MEAGKKMGQGFKFFHEPVAFSGFDCICYVVVQIAAADIFFNQKAVDGLILADRTYHTPRFFVKPYFSNRDKVCKLPVE